MLTDLVVTALRPIPFRGKLRLLESFVPKHGVKLTEIFGSHMELDLADDIQRNIYLGTYEPIETQWVREWLKPGMCVVDVGANVGYYSALAAECVGTSGRVISIEPQPDIYKKLVRMMEDAPVARSVVFCGGLSEQSDSLALFLPAEKNSHNATMVAHGDLSRAVPVPVRALDDCMEEWGLSHIDLLKIDVEGHELAVLRGAHKSIAAGRVRAAVCELNDPWLRLCGSSQRELYESFIMSGFVDMHGNTEFSGPVENRFFVFSQ